jgi:DNA-binding transcriptional ArsR family regulator
MVSRRTSMRERPDTTTRSLSTQVLKALANESRLQIMRWLQDPRAHFPPQVEGDLVEDGVCGLFIAQKLGVGQPTASEHLRILVQVGLLRAKRIKQWTFYRRDEKRIVDVKRELKDGW